MQTLPKQSNPVNSSSVAILFAHPQSHYFTLPDLDVYDLERDALTFAGGVPVVAHPPCRAWGRLRHMAKPRQGEKELAFWAVDQVRKCGGVLEHPSGSALWSYLDLPLGRDVDSFGGFSLKVDQCHWGHKAQKKTLLYVCGCSRADVPQMPLSFSCIDYVVDGQLRPGMQHLPKSQREITPPAFASWLVDLASRCG